MCTHTKVHNIWGTYKNDWRGWNRHYQCISLIRLGLQWKLRTLDKPFGFLVLKPSGVRLAEVSFRNYLVNRGFMAGIEIRIIFIWVMYNWAIVRHSGGLEYSRSGFRWQSS